MLFGGTFPLQSAGDIRAGNERHLISICVMSLDFFVTNRKGRTLYQALIVDIANEQLRSLTGNLGEVGCVPIASVVGKGHYRRPVIDGIDLAKHLSRQSENITHKYVEIFCAPLLYFSSC